MNLLVDWQWEGVAGAVVALLILCGVIKWLNENKQHGINQTINEDIQIQPISINTEQVATDIANIEKINQLEKELEESKEEAELCLLQLHQVQEELEHYFLLSQDLQQKVENAAEAVNLLPDDKIQKITNLRTSLAALIHRNNKKDMQIELLVNHQREALLRASSALKRARHKQNPFIETKGEIAFL
jgi:hypothetical protein